MKHDGNIREAQQETAAAPRLRRRRRSAAETREILLDAAASEFNRAGYFNTDSNKLARIAGYAPGTFYKHFQDKRDIFLAAYEKWVVTEWDEIRECIEDGREGLSPRLIAKILDHHKRWRGFRSDLRALAATDKTVSSFQHDLRKRQIAAYGELVTIAGGRPKPASEILFILLCLERICDAIADGDIAAQGGKDAVMIAELEKLADRLFS